MIESNKHLRLKVVDYTNFQLGWRVWLCAFGNSVFLASFKTRSQAREFAKSFKKKLP